MTTGIDFKKIEKKVWTSYFEDGLWDIVLAVYMLTPAIRAFTDNVWFTLLFIVAPLVLIVGRRLITVPRIGRVEFGSARKTRQRRVWMVFGLTGFVANVILLVVLVVVDPSIAWIRTTILGICLGVILGLVAYLIDVARLYVYFLVLVTGYVLWDIFGDPTGPIFLALSGAITMVVGLSLFVRFVRKYPRISVEQMNVND